MTTPTARLTFWSVFWALLPLVGLASIACAQCAGTWTEHTPAGPTPGLRRLPAMTFDQARAVTLLFGGDGAENGAPATDQPRADTWTWNGSTWALVATRGPSARIASTAAYDPANSRVLLFGGYVEAGASLQTYNDLWSWNGLTWTNITPATAIPARFQHAMAFDSARNRLVVFGGYNGSTQIGDTWEYDGTDWILRPRAEVGGPAARSHCRMAFDASRGVCVLVGGVTTIGGVQFFFDTWEYNGIAWSRIVENSSPPVDALDYDTDQEWVFLREESTNTTWYWNGFAWIGAVSGGPSPRFYGGWAYDTRRHRHVLYGGGFGGPQTALEDTWELSFVPTVSTPASIDASAPETTSFSVTASGGGPLTYQWRRDGQPLTDGPTGAGSIILGAATATLTIESTRVSDAGAYDCVVTNPCGAVNSGSAALNVGCLADFNGDGNRDPDDLADYITTFFTSGC